MFILLTAALPLVWITWSDSTEVGNFEETSARRPDSAQTLVTKWTTLFKLFSNTGGCGRCFDNPKLDWRYWKKGTNKTTKTFWTFDYGRSLYFVHRTRWNEFTLFQLNIYWRNLHWLGLFQGIFLQSLQIGWFCMEKFDRLRVGGPICSICFFYPLSGREAVPHQNGLLPTTTPCFSETCYRFWGLVDICVFFGKSATIFY